MDMEKLVICDHANICNIVECEHIKPHMAKQNDSCDMCICPFDDELVKCIPVKSKKEKVKYKCTECLAKCKVKQNNGFRAPEYCIIDGNYLVNWVLVK